MSRNATSKHPSPFLWRWVYFHGSLCNSAFHYSFFLPVVFTAYYFWVTNSILISIFLNYYLSSNSVVSIDTDPALKSLHSRLTTQNMPTFKSSFFIVSFFKLPQAGGNVWQYILLAWIRILRLCQYVVCGAALSCIFLSIIYIKMHLKDCLFVWKLKFLSWLGKKCQVHIKQNSLCEQ